MFEIALKVVSFIVGLISAFLGKKRHEDLKNKLDQILSAVKEIQQIHESENHHNAKRHNAKRSPVDDDPLPEGMEDEYGFTSQNYRNAEEIFNVAISHANLIDRIYFWIYILVGLPILLTISYLILHDVPMDFKAVLGAIGFGSIAGIGIAALLAEAYKDTHQKLVGVIVKRSIIDKKKSECCLAAHWMAIDPNYTYYAKVFNTSIVVLNAKDY